MTRHQILANASVNNMIASSSVALSAEEQENLNERTNAITKIEKNTQLAEKYHVISTMIGNNSRDNISFLFTLGSVLAEVRNNERNYGKGAYKLLKTAIGYSEALLSKAAKFATEYDADEANAISQMSSTDGYTLSLEHLRHILCDVSQATDPEVALQENKEFRRGMMERCIAGRWTTKEVQYYVQQAKEALGIETRQGGRPRVTATNKNRALFEARDAFLKLNKVFRNSILAETGDLIHVLTSNFDGVDADTIDLLAEFDEQLNTLKQNVDTLRAGLATDTLRLQMIEYLGGVSESNVVETDSPTLQPNTAPLDFEEDEDEELENYLKNN